MENLEGKLKKVKLIVSDVDGVLTDGKIYLSERCGEIKVFSVKDAIRIEVAFKSGIKVLLITARKGFGVMRRAEELGADIIFKQDLQQKNLSLLTEVKRKFHIEPEEILYVGDDWNDLYLMKQVGVSATPANGSAENREIADIVTEVRGGEGVVSELIEKIMRAQGTWEEYFKEYLLKLIP